MRPACGISAAMRRGQGSHLDAERPVQVGRSSAAPACRGRGASAAAATARPGWARRRAGSAGGARPAARRQWPPLQEMCSAGQRARPAPGAARGRTANAPGRRPLAASAAAAAARRSSTAAPARRSLRPPPAPSAGWRRRCRRGSPGRSPAGASRCRSTSSRRGVVHRVVELRRRDHPVVGRASASRMSADAAGRRHCRCRTRRAGEPGARPDAQRRLVRHRQGQADHRAGAAALGWPAGARAAAAATAPGAAVQGAPRPGSAGSPPSLPGPGPQTETPRG